MQDVSLFAGVPREDLERLLSDGLGKSLARLRWGIMGDIDTWLELIPSIEKLFADAIQTVRSQCFSEINNCEPRHDWAHTRKVGYKCRVLTSVITVGYNRSEDLILLNQSISISLGEGTGTPVRKRKCIRLCIKPIGILDDGYNFEYTLLTFENKTHKQTNQEN